MLRFILIMVASFAVAHTSAAQTPNPTLAGSSPLTGVQRTDAPSLPLFLKAAQASQDFSNYWRTRETRTKLRECPMPVLRPDSTRGDLILNVPLPRTGDEAMVTALSCPNPLDTKATSAPFVRTETPGWFPLPAKF